MVVLYFKSHFFKILKKTFLGTGSRHGTRTNDYMTIVETPPVYKGLTICFVATFYHSPNIAICTSALTTKTKVLKIF